MDWRFVAPAAREGGEFVRCASGGGFLAEQLLLSRRERAFFFDHAFGAGAVDEGFALGEAPLRLVMVGARWRRRFPSPGGGSGRLHWPWRGLRGQWRRLRPGASRRTFCSMQRAARRFRSVPSKQPLADKAPPAKRPTQHSGISQQFISNRAGLLSDATRASGCNLKKRHAAPWKLGATWQSKATPHSARNGRQTRGRNNARPRRGGHRQGRILAWTREKSSSFSRNRGHSARLGNTETAGRQVRARCVTREIYNEYRWGNGANRRRACGGERRRGEREDLRSSGVDEQETAQARCHSRIGVHNQAEAAARSAGVSGDLLASASASRIWLRRGRGHSTAPQFSDWARHWSRRFLDSLLRALLGRLVVALFRRQGKSCARNGRDGHGRIHNPSPWPRVWRPGNCVPQVLGNGSVRPERHLPARRPMAHKRCCSCGRGKVDGPLRQWECGPRQR